MARKSKLVGEKKAKLPKLPVVMKKNLLRIGQKLIKYTLLDKPPTREVVLDAANDLSNDNKRVRMAAAECLELAAQKGTDISPAFPSLTKALSDNEAEVRRHVVAAFFFSSRRGDTTLGFENIDITLAIPELVKRLSDPDAEIAFNAGAVLGNRRYAQITIPLIMELIHSDWFRQKMEKNSPVYESTAKNVARVLSMIKGQEKRGEMDP